MRPKLKSEHPELSFGDLGRKLGEMFRGLDASKKQSDGVDDDDSNDSDNDDDDDSSDEN